MTMLRGMTVKLYEKRKIGTDGFNQPIFEETPVDVDNVLVSPEETSNVSTGQDLHGKKEVYILGIPKKDTHEWRDRRVEFFGRVFNTVGVPKEGIEDLIPLEWNKTVRVERYE